MQTLLLTIVLAIYALSLSAQSEGDVVKSFTTNAPDTVEQGVPFTVVYQLTAKHWQAGGKPMEGNGFARTGVKYATTKADPPYSMLQATTTYLTSDCGLKRLPGMRQPIDGKFILSAPKDVYVKPNSRYGKEMTLAHEWLVKNGKQQDSLCLRMAVEDQTFWVFQDDHNPCFCVVAKKDVWVLTGNPILAYSTENRMNLGDDMTNYNNIVTPFRQQIDAMKRRAGGAGQHGAVALRPQNVSVAPLLGKLRWGQGKPYNTCSPKTANGQKSIIGCVPLAVTMIMNYHKWPATTQSHAYYTADDKVYKVDFANRQPLWDSYRDEYKEGEAHEAYDLSQLLVLTGAALNARYGSETTSTTSTHIKHVLCNNMCYSGRITFHDQMTDDQMTALLYGELDARRPCLVSSDNHAFVCDGYQGDFFHLNLGWHGQFNGYYRLKLGDYDDRSLLLVKHVFTGIEPLYQQVSREVTLEKAGTLASLLTDAEKASVTQLTVSGPLNSSDISLLRKMAGARDQQDFDSWQGGALRTLNMEKAVITDDPAPYYSRDASGWTWTRHQTHNGATTTERFTFSNMPLEQWNKIKTEAETDKNGSYFSRTDDTHYTVHFTCRQGVIGKYMFYDCTSLHTIVMPENTTKVDDYAFRDCSSIQTIRLPQSVEESGKKPFSNCTSLETVEAPASLHLTRDCYEDCSPAFTVKRY